MKLNTFFLVCLASSLSACYAEPPPIISGSVLGNVVNGSGNNPPPNRQEIPDPPMRGTPLKVVGNTAFIDSSLPARFSEIGRKIPDYYQHLDSALDSRNPELDALEALKRGERYLLIHTQSNPSAAPDKKYAMFITRPNGDPPLPLGNRKINCGLKYIQGMEASVDSENREMLATSQKLSIYGNEWNNIMWSVCQITP